MKKKAKLLFFGSILVFTFYFGFAIEQSSQESGISLTLKNVVALAWTDSESGGWGGIYCAEGCTPLFGDVCVQCRTGGDCTPYDNHNEFGYPIKCYNVIGY